MTASTREKGQPQAGNAPWDFFIPHASADANQAELLYSMLSNTHRTFLASRCIAAGTDWDSSLHAALHSSRVIVPLVSAKTKDSFFQRAEFTRAVQLAHAHPSRYRVVPVDLDGTLATADAPLALDLKQWLKTGQRGEFDYVVQYLRELVHPSPDTEDHTETTAVSYSHLLMRYPPGPMVEDAIDRSIVRQSARLIPTFEAPSVIDEAAHNCRSAGDSDVTVVESVYLPPPDTTQPAHYWQVAFREAKNHGPRMLAALLLVVSDEQFPPEAKRAKARLLARLTHGGEK